MLKSFIMPAVLNASLSIAPPNPSLTGGWREYFSWMDDLVQKTSSPMMGNRSVNYSAKNHPEAQRLANGLSSLRSQMERISQEPITTELLMNNGNNNHQENLPIDYTRQYNVDDVFLKLLDYFRTIVSNNDRLKLFDLKSDVMEFFNKLGNTLWSEVPKYTKAHDTLGLNTVAKRLEQMPESSPLKPLPEYKGLRTDWGAFCDWFDDLFTLLYPPSIPSPTRGARGVELDQITLNKNESEIRSGMRLLSTALQDLSNEEGIAALERTDYGIGEIPLYQIDLRRHRDSGAIQTEDVFPSILHYLKELQKVLGETDPTLIDNLKRIYARFANQRLTTGQSRFEILEKFTK